MQRQADIKTIHAVSDCRDHWSTVTRVSPSPEKFWTVFRSLQLKKMSCYMHTPGQRTLPSNNTQGSIARREQNQTSPALPEFCPGIHCCYEESSIVFGTQWLPLKHYLNNILLVSICKMNFHPSSPLILTIAPWASWYKNIHCGSPECYSPNSSSSPSCWAYYKIVLLASLGLEVAKWPTLTNEMWVEWCELLAGGSCKTQSPSLYPVVSVLLPQKLEMFLMVTIVSFWDLK